MDLNIVIFSVTLSGQQEHTMVLSTDIVIPGV
jgi:hypothetical protein